MTRNHRFCFALGIVLSLLLARTPVWSGGDQDDDHDHERDGLQFFGFVKESGGRVVRDARITAQIKGLGAVIARSDATGVYKLPSFGKNVTPDHVSISCSKDGYKQVRTITRTSLTKKPLTAVEIECIMDRTK
jgi:hypothetical protein